MTESTIAGADFDAHFLLWFVGILSTGVLSVIFGFILIGWLAFRRDQHLAETYIQIFAGGEALRMFCITGILVAVLCLAFAKIIDGQVAASILSAMVGFVLGGVTRPKDRIKKSDPRAESNE